MGRLVVELLLTHYKKCVFKNNTFLKSIDTLIQNSFINSQNDWTILGLQISTRHNVIFVYFKL